MNKVILTLFLCLIFCNIGFAESYYFKECKLTQTLTGNYVIDFDKNLIKVSLKATDGSHQELTDKIKLIGKDQITSEKIQSGTSKDSYFVYYLDAKSRSVIKQKYTKSGEVDFFSPDGPKRQSYCVNVKADWNISKIEKTEISKEQEQILKIQKQMLKEQISELKCQGNDSKKWTNCEGTYTAKDGSKYFGQFKDGKILLGTATYPGGAKYAGVFKNDKPHGEGTFTYSDGSQYVGNWKNGKNHGHGAKTWLDGTKYAGVFKNDKPHGEGTFTYSDGSKYVGEHKDGKRHGEGTFTYSDGRAYIGQFVAGLEHGTGICINQDRSSVSCKILKMEGRDTSVGKNRRSISIAAKKWVKLNEYESASGKGKKILEQLKYDFDKRASELCSLTGNYNILKKRIEMLEIDETPAFGLEPKIKLGIDGVVECK